MTYETTGDPTMEGADRQDDDPRNVVVERHTITVDEDGVECSVHGQVASSAHDDDGFDAPEYFARTARFHAGDGHAVVADWCGSGWTGDRCSYTSGHQGRHSNP